VDSDGPISCGAIDLARARAYEERCEDSFREYTLNDRIEQDCCEPSSAAFENALNCGGHSAVSLRHLPEAGQRSETGERSS
jgi:hypothetical protein